MTTDQPPYRRFCGFPKLGHDDASALAAFPIKSISAALELIRTGRTAMAVTVLETVPQEIYDSAYAISGRGFAEGWDEHAIAARREAAARRAGHPVSSPPAREPVSPRPPTLADDDDERPLTAVASVAPSTGHGDVARGHPPAPRPQPGRGKSTNGRPTMTSASRRLRMPRPGGRIEAADRVIRRPDRRSGLPRRASPPAARPAVPRPRYDALADRSAGGGLPKTLELAYIQQPQVGARMPPMQPEIAQFPPTKPLRRKAKPAEAGSRAYVGRLDTLHACRRQAARLFADARRGELNVADASKLVNMCRVIGELIQLAEIEPRLAALEAQQP